MIREPLITFIIFEKIILSDVKVEIEWSEDLQEVYIYRVYDSIQKEKCFK